jgi:hypothetical protein
MPKQKRVRVPKKQRAPLIVKPNVLANNVSPRPIARRSVRRRKQMAARGAKPHHVAAVCSVTDPFCPASKNSKWPDGTSGNTLTEQFRGNTVLACFPGGKNVFAFAPNAPFGYIAGSAEAGNDITLGAAYQTYRGGSMLATYGDKVRVVSAGCVVRCIAAATTAQGIVTFGTAPPPLVNQVVTTGQELYQEVAIRAIQPGMEFSWIATPKGTGARDFQAQSTSTSVDNDWNALWIEISGGGVSQNLLNIEWFINVEFDAKVTSRALTQIAKPNPAKSSTAEQATSHVHKSIGSFIEGGVTAVESTVAKAAKEALDSFMDDPLDSIASLFSMF